MGMPSKQQDETMLLWSAVGIVLFSIIAIIVFILGNSILFYIAAIIAIVLGFYLSRTLAASDKDLRKESKK